MRRNALSLQKYTSSYHNRTIYGHVTNPRLNCVSTARITVAETYWYNERARSEAPILPTFPFLSPRLIQIFPAKENLNFLGKVS